nr:MAG TPA: hypothetical protein [Caudoviricetes sp.]
MATIKLNSVPTLVESPFIIVTIGKYTLGSYTGNKTTTSLGMLAQVNFPNFVNSLNITKVNGTVNTYTIGIVYQIAPGDDPNLIDKIFSSVSATRRLSLSYGDWRNPASIYKEETALITNVTSSLDMSASKITYTIQCVSDAMSLASAVYDFPAREAKPSDIIKEMLKDVGYGLLTVFKGMVDFQRVITNGLIASNDKKVKIEARQNMNIIEYLNFLVGAMTSVDSESKDTIIQSGNYYLAIHDDITNALGGTYFEVKEVKAGTKVSNYDVYEVDVGYPGDNFVTQFNLTNNQQYTILYDYAGKIEQTKYIYSIDNNGQLTTQYAPSIARSKSLQKVTEQNKNWWTKVTQFPIQATLTIKGLTRPSILMSQVRINTVMYGQKHISSGLYIITKQQDKLDSNGYTTTLTLLRIGGDE